MAFRHPHILYALGLLLIPLLVHLLRLQRFRLVDFPNVDFLRQLERQSRRSRRLRRYILLAVRMLIFALLVLAFAGPYLPAGHNGPRREMWLYLDRSPLTSYHSGQQSIADMLAARAARIVKQSPQWHVINAAGQVQVLSPDDWLRQNAVNSPSCLATGPRQILQRINRYDTLPKKIFFLTAGQGLDSSIRKFLLPENEYFFYVHPPREFVNTLVDTLFVAGGDAGTLRLACVLRRYGPAVNTVLSLENGGQLLGKQSVKLNANGIDTLYFRIDKQNGAPRAMVRCASDGHFSPDDRLYFSLPPRHKPRVLLVGDSIPDYWNKLWSAIDVRWEKTDASHIPYEQAVQYDLVILRGWKNFLHRNQLAARFARAALVFVPSGRPRADKLFYGPQTRSDTGRLQVSGIRWRDPVFRGMFRKRPQRVFTPYTALHYVNPALSSNAALMLENDHPFLARQGRWWIFLGAIDQPYGNFFLSPLMSGLFYRWAYGGGPSKPLYDYCSDQLTLEIPAPPDDIPVRMLRGSESIIPYQEMRNSKRRLFPDVHHIRPGVYALVHGTDTLGFRAINIDRRLSRQPVKPAGFSDGATNVHLLDDAGGRALRSASRDFTRMLLWLALLFVLVEILILRLWKIS